MSDIIKNGRVHADEWTVLRLAEGDEAATIALPAGRVIVPLAVWQARREELLPKAEAGVLGVWLAGTENPAALTADLSALPLVAVDFPKFADGRGYSIATLLRTRLGYGGELRAIGNVCATSSSSCCAAASACCNRRRASTRRLSSTPHSPA